jgi:hypothetical protein
MLPVRDNPGQPGPGSRRTGYADGADCYLQLDHLAGSLVLWIPIHQRI